MAAPAKIARNHAFIITLGGEYRGAAIDAAVIREAHEYGGREKLVSVASFGSRHVQVRKSWTWGLKDIKWVSKHSLYHDRKHSFHVDDYADAKTLKAINKYDGAWVVRLRVS